MATEEEEFEFRARAEKESQNEPKTDWRQVIGSAAKGAFTRPLSAAKDLGSNPQTMANAMPGLLGIAGGFSPIPGAATLGTGAGQGIRDLALKTLGKPIPSGMQHGLELGGAALGDIAAIPAIKGKIFGGQIGKAEQGAGVITRAPTKGVTPGSVGQVLNDLEAQIDAGTVHSAQAARDALAVVKQVYKNPKIYEQTGEIATQAQRVSEKAQELINTLIPARRAPAEAMAKAYTIPRILGAGYKAIPRPLKQAAGIAGAGGLAGLGWETIKKLLGG